MNRTEAQQKEWDLCPKITCSRPPVRERSVSPVAALGTIERPSIPTNPITPDKNSKSNSKPMARVTTPSNVTPSTVVDLTGSDSNNHTKILKVTESILAVCNTLLSVNDLTADEKVQVIQNINDSSLFDAPHNNNNNNHKL